MIASRASFGLLSFDLLLSSPCVNGRFIQRSRFGHTADLFDCNDDLSSFRSPRKSASVPIGTNHRLRLLLSGTDRRSRSTSLQPVSHRRTTEPSVVDGFDGYTTWLMAATRWPSVRTSNTAAQLAANWLISESFTSHSARGSGFNQYTRLAREESAAKSARPAAR